MPVTFCVPAERLMQMLSIKCKQTRMIKNLKFKIEVRIELNSTIREQGIRFWDERTFWLEIIFKSNPYFWLTSVYRSAKSGD